MIDQLRENVIQLPSIRAAVEQAIAQLSAGHCFVQLRPKTLPSHPVSSAVLTALHQRGFRVESVDAVDIDAKQLPHSLRARLTPGAAVSASLDRLMDDLADGQIIHVEGIDRLQPHEQDRWLQLVTMWSRACQVRKDSGREVPVLLCDFALQDCVLLKVESDLCLRVSWWWSIPSALEWQLACRHINGAAGDRNSSLWCENVACSLASGDAEFTTIIWPATTEPLAVLKRAVSDYGRQRGWVGEEFCRLISAAKCKSGITGKDIRIVDEEPPKELWALWNRGVVYCSHEFGCELHSAALAALTDASALEARLWRGQSTVVLPRLEIVRQRICGYLTQRYGNEWAIKWLRPETLVEEEEVTDSPWSCQWGHLHRLLSQTSQLRSERNRLLPSVSIGRQLRNALAHGRAVEYQDYLRFCQESEVVSPKLKM